VESAAARRSESGSNTQDNTVQHSATHCTTPWSLVESAAARRSESSSNTQDNTLQHTATHCNTLQHTATHCKTLHHTLILNGVGSSKAFRKWQFSRISQWLMENTVL